jgi:acyl carrier protein
MGDNTELKIRQAISKITRAPEKNIKSDSNLLSIGMDSFGAIDLIYTLEDMFNIRISDSEIKDLKTFEDVVKAVKLKLNSVNK